MDWKDLLKQLRDGLETVKSQLGFSAKPNQETETNSADLPINLQQRLLARKKLIAVVGAIALVLVSLSLFMGHSKPLSETKEVPSKAVKESDFSSPLDGLNEQTVWMERAENKLKQAQKNNDTLQTAIKKQAVTVEAQNELVANQAATIQQLNQAISTLSAKVDALATAKTSPSVAVNENVSNPANPSPDLSGMTVTTLALAPMPSNQDKGVDKTTNNYVPSGSYVKAVMLGGLDASAGVNSQSNPRPVLLRTIDSGTLPNNLPSHLKNCRLIGAGYGDLSSERAYIRLESMSCMREGKIVDFPVYGYVSGPDGKDGVRGTVVMRDGELVGKAFIGGALSGFGDSVSDNYTETSISPLGSTTSVKNGENLEYGAAQGVSNAADLYAQYNIKRAEQLQPVIEVSAGTVVDVVFNKGFYLEGQADDGQAKTISLKHNAEVSTGNSLSPGLVQGTSFGTPQNVGALVNQFGQQNLANQIASQPATISEGAEASGETFP